MNMEISQRLWFQNIIAQVQKAVRLLWYAISLPEFYALLQMCASTNQRLRFGGVVDYKMASQVGKTSNFDQVFCEILQTLAMFRDLCNIFSSENLSNP